MPDHFKTLYGVMKFVKEPSACEVEQDYQKIGKNAEFFEKVANMSKYLHQSLILKFKSLYQNTFLKP